MPNKHNDARRHHILKMKFKETNWAAYQAGLRRRGSLTLWVSDDAVAAWYAAPRTTPDGQARYSVAERAPAARVVIPPRSTAVPGSAAEPTQRDEHIQVIAENGRLGWQRETGYGKRSKAETAMARYKRTLGDQLHARTLPGQQAEVAVGVTILNRMIDQARPNSVRSA